MLCWAAPNDALGSWNYCCWTNRMLHCAVFTNFRRGSHSIFASLRLWGSPPLILDNHHSCTVSVDTLTLGPDPDLPVPFRFSLLPIDKQLSSPFMWSFDLVRYDRLMVLVILYPPTTFAIYLQVSPLSPLFFHTGYWSYVILGSMNNSGRFWVMAWETYFSSMTVYCIVIRRWIMVL